MTRRGPAALRPRTLEPRPPLYEFDIVADLRPFDLPRHWTSSQRQDWAEEVERFADRCIPAKIRAATARGAIEAYETAMDLRNGPVVLTAPDFGPREAAMVSIRVTSMVQVSP